MLFSFPQILECDGIIFVFLTNNTNKVLFCLLVLLIRDIIKSIKEFVDKTKPSFFNQYIFIEHLLCASHFPGTKTDKKIFSQGV